MHISDIQMNILSADMHITCRSPSMFMNCNMAEVGYFLKYNALTLNLTFQGHSREYLIVQLDSPYRTSY